MHFNCALRLLHNEYMALRVWDAANALSLRFAVNASRTHALCRYVCIDSSSGFCADILANPRAHLPERNDSNIRRETRGGTHSLPNIERGTTAVTSADSFPLTMQIAASGPTVQTARFNERIFGSSMEYKPSLSRSRVEAEICGE